MVLTSPEKESLEHTSDSPKRLSLVFLLSLSSFMALCAKHANRLSIKLKTTATKPSNHHHHHHHHHHDGNKSPKLQSLKSPAVRPKQLLTQISNKAIKLIHHKKRVGEGNEAVDIVAPDEFGDGGVWQKEILMGDKCQPLDFSGVIYYDGTGKQINEIPLRSPRASPSPRYLTREKMKY